MPRTPLKAIAQVQAVFAVAVISAKDPPDDAVFELQLTKPDGTQVTTRLCARTKTNPCSSGPLHLWVFPPKTTGQATYRLFYGRGSPSTELTHGTVDLLHSKTYYLEYKG